MPNTDSQIRSAVDEFVTQITELVRQQAVEAVREALGDGAPARAPRRKKAAKRGRKAGKKAGRRSTGKRVRRSAEDLEALGGSLLAYVRANPGQGIEDISKGLRADSKDLKRPVTLLLEADKLRTEGQKRGTKYFAK